VVAECQHTGAGAHYIVGPALGRREDLPGEWEDAPAEDPIRRETARRLAEILGVAGHEMKTPLTVVQLSLQRVLRQLSRSLHRDAERPEPARALEGTWEMLQLMEYEVKRLGQFVDDLLDVSRVETGKLDFATERCDLVTLVGTAVMEQRLIWPARRIVYDAAAGATAPVLADPRRIGQVVANYLTNALRCSPADRPVEVWVEIEATEARICVRDHGPGLPATEQERVWEPFQQVEGGAPRGGAGGGLGLGLYITRSIAEHCHGEVGLESAPGAGATFWFNVSSG
jgi:signal transduction histidine kinase